MTSSRKLSRAVTTSLMALATLVVASACSFNSTPPGLEVPVPSVAADAPRTPIEPPEHSTAPEPTYGGQFYDRSTVMAAIVVDADERRWQISAFDHLEGDALKRVSPAVNEGVIPSTNLYALVFDLQWVETAETPSPFAPSYDFDIVAVGENGKKYDTYNPDITLAEVNDFATLEVNAGQVANSVVAVASTGADTTNISHWLAVNNEGVEFRINII